MNWIEKMIAEQCPNGVERVKLGDVCEISIGEFVHKNNQDDSFEFPVYNGGTSYTGFYNKFNSLAGNVIVSARGANAGFVNLVNRNFWAGNSCYSICTLDKKIVSNIFIYNILKNSQNTLIENQQKGGGIPAISKKQMEGFEIPLPPPSIQEEIVSVLDKFSELIEKTDEEIALRQKQYEYYREKLLTFEKGEVEMVKISSFTKILRGKRLTKKQLSESEKYPVYHGGQEPIGYYSDYNRDANTVMVINVGASAGTVGYCDRDFWSSDGCFCLEKNPNVNDKYLYVALLGKEVAIKAKVRHAGIPTLDQNVIERLEIPIPSPSRQQSIVATLDKFEALISKLKEERELRQKQYEYYREKLLTF